MYIRYFSSALRLSAVVINNSNTNKLLLWTILVITRETQNTDITEYIIFYLHRSHDLHRPIYHYNQSQGQKLNRIKQRQRDYIIWTKINNNNNDNDLTASQRYRTYSVTCSAGLF